jgi:hypothetical protein
MLRNATLAVAECDDCVINLPRPARISNTVVPNDALFVIASAAKQSSVWIAAPLRVSR